MNRDNTGTSYYSDSNDYPYNYAYQPLPYGNIQPVPPQYHLPSQSVNAYGRHDHVNFIADQAPPQAHYGGYMYDPNLVFYGSNSNNPLLSPLNEAVYPEWSTSVQSDVQSAEVDIGSPGTSATQNNELNSNISGKTRRFSAQRSNKEGRPNLNTESSQNSVSNLNNLEAKPIRFSHQSKEKSKKYEKKKREKVDNYKKKGKIQAYDVPDGSQINILQEQLSNGSYECMVCCERVKQHHAIWNCFKCYHVFHMGCIRKWARSENARVEGGGYRCPACQGTIKSFPNAYFCYCGKLKNPELNHNEMAHSCGEVCGKRRVGNKNCNHLCNILCHPGPCPSCPTMVDKYCDCGKTTKKLRCGKVIQFKCDNKCDKLKSCGVHKCDGECHSGDCEPCDEKVSQVCFCGSSNRVIICGTEEYNLTKTEEDKPAYSCGNVCDKLLDCSNHHCKDDCHKGECKRCTYLPSMVKRCPCAQTEISKIKDDSGNPVQRKSCLDPIPVCSKICNKPLRCGGDSIHYCKSKCHDGDCPPCPDQETYINCRCGKSEITISCEKYVVGIKDAKEYTCDRRCNKKRKCGRHKCGQICCKDSEHLCSQICGRKLSCGQHRCEDICHRGQCHSCYNVSFDDLTCYCGAEVILPPIQCGTKPPECGNICTREHSCFHPVQHTCHSEETCPPCVQLVRKTCNCGRVVRNSIPCYQKNVSCGLPCNKMLSCGHNCLKTCHNGLCLSAEETCKQSCSTMRIECIHPCANPCHQNEPCPTTPCKATITQKCACGNRQKPTECSISIKQQQEMSTEIIAKQASGSVDITALCQGNSGTRHYLPCNDQCRILERNRKMAEALQIDTEKLEEDLEKQLYSNCLLDMVQRDPKFIESLEQEFANVVDSVKWLGRPKVHAFPPMKKDKRQAIHELAEVYSCYSQSFDEEPKRNVTVTSSASSHLPSILLSNIVKKRIKTSDTQYDKPRDDNTASSTRLLKSMKLVSLSTPKEDTGNVGRRVIPSMSTAIQPVRQLPSNSEAVRPKMQPRTSVKKAEKLPEKEIDYFDFKD